MLTVFKEDIRKGSMTFLGYSVKVNTQNEVVYFAPRFFDVATCISGVFFFVFPPLYL